MIINSQCNIPFVAVKHLYCFKTSALNKMKHLEKVFLNIRKTLLGEIKATSIIFKMNKNNVIIQNNEL